MAQAFALPDYPPDGPWELYVGILIWVPAILRILLLWRPVYRVVYAFSPTNVENLSFRKLFKWWKELPIKGVGVFLINEFAILMTVPTVAFAFRLFSDPVGWTTWGETQQFGLIFILISFTIWIIIDLFFIMKSRGILIMLANKDIEKMALYADLIMKGRNALNWVAKPYLDEKGGVDPKKVEKTSMLQKVKKSGKIIGSSLFGLKVTLGVKGALWGAGKISDKVREKIDQKLQHEFDKITKRGPKAIIKSFSINIIMGLGPILVLLLAPILF